MNSHCGICDVESQCGYEYKPCDCCNYRKFKPIDTQAMKPLAPVYDFSKFKEVRHWEQNK